MNSIKIKDKDINIVAVKKLDPNFAEGIKSGKKKYEGRDELIDGWTLFVNPNESLIQPTIKNFSRYIFYKNKKYNLIKFENKFYTSINNKWYEVFFIANLKPFALNPKLSRDELHWHKYFKSCEKCELCSKNLRIRRCENPTQIAETPYLFDDMINWHKIDQETYNFWKENFVNKGKSFVVHEITEVIEYE